MSITEKIEILENFKQSEVFQELQTFIAARVNTEYELLAEPIDGNNIYAHSRAGGFVSGLKYDSISALIDELKRQQEPKE
jgi:hypothetical protein